MGKILGFLLGTVIPFGLQEETPAEFKRRIALLIESLADPDVEVRESVLGQLRRIGPDIESILRANMDHSDSEVACRCRDLVREIEATWYLGRWRIWGKVRHVESQQPDPKYNFILVDVGSKEKFKPGERFTILRGDWSKEGSVKGFCRLATAEFEPCVVLGETCAKLKVIEGRASDVQVGDRVATPRDADLVVPNLRAAGDAKPALWLSGKIALVDERRGVATDVRRRDGAMPGDRLNVMRQAKKIGTLVVTDVQEWGSWAKPDGDTKLEDFKKGDAVERATK